MKTVRIAITLLFVLVTSATFAASGAQKSFEQLKSLDGLWEGKSETGEPIEVDYRVTSNGSAMMGEIKGKENMISMFSVDGDHVLLTHYCAMGNQPRMVAGASPDGKSFTFNFVDAANLAAPDAPTLPAWCWRCRMRITTPRSGSLRTTAKSTRQCSICSEKSKSMATAEGRAGTPFLL